MSTVGRTLHMLKRMNWPITAAICVLMVIGVMFVYGSCYLSEDQPVRPLWIKQILWGIAGLFCYAALSLTDYQKVLRLSWWFYGATLALLLLVLVAGTKVYGARRWLMFLGVGIQPSEFAKLATVIALAGMLNRSGKDFGHLGPVFAVLAAVVVPVLLIMKEPDLGTAMIFVPTVFIMMFAAGVPLRTLGILVAIGLTSIAVVLTALFLPAKLGVSHEREKRIMRMVGMSGYLKDRIMVFLGSERDPLGAGWNRKQSEIAVGSGGPWGKGFLRGTQNVLGFLPRSVAPTDFIYSVIAEETGFFGSAVVLLLFGIVLFFSLQTALTARDKAGRLLCTGIVGIIFCHVFINIAMTVGLMPITGLPLPLLSYGGSFIIVVMSALGMVQSIFMRSRYL